MDKKKQEKETRKLKLENVEFRESTDEKGNKNLIIEGYFSKFNTKSSYMGFYEYIDSKAFDNTLKDGHNIFCLYAHDWDKVLGDTETGTLVLEKDNIGVHFTLTIDTSISYCSDVYRLCKNGLIKGCSFGMIVNDDNWRTNENYEDIRTLLDVTLLEVTLTPIPAYEDTNATCRSYKNYIEGKENKEKLNKEIREMELELINLELG